jgi:hypothetical protein
MEYTHDSHFAPKLILDLARLDCVRAVFANDLEEVLNRQ